jgi:hypothetical protein
MEKTHLSFLVGLITILFSLNSNSQDFEFVKTDETFQLAQKFSNTDTIIIVIPDEPVKNPSDKSLIAGWNFWGSKAIYKKESELQKEDFLKHIHVLGPLNHFKTNELLQIPVKQDKQGFSFHDKLFSHINDAFYYLNDDGTRLYTSGNSYHSTDQLKRHVLGAYQIYIFRDNEMLFSGFCSNKTGIDSINDLEQSRKIYFDVKSIKYFDLNIAKSYNCDSIYNLASKELDIYIINLAKKLNSDTKDLEKTKAYIYANRIDLQHFLGIPLVMQMWGLNVNNVIHSCNYDIGTIKHEATHNFILQKIGNNTNNFFAEGFRQYTEYLFDENKYKLDKDTTLTHLDLLTINLTSGNSNVFFSNPQSYPISGVFVKYIIDKIGLDSFKDLYSKNQIDVDIKVKFGYSLEQLIEEFKVKIKK